MSRSELSVQLYTVRTALAEDLPGTLGRIAGLGFRDVELFDFVDQAQEYVVQLAACGLRAPSGHASLLGEDTSRVFDAAEAIGMRTVIQSMVPAEQWADDEGIRATATALNAVAAEAADRGLQVGYHNHWWELQSTIGGMNALERFAGYLDDAVVLEVDTYWVQTGGVDAAALLRRLGDRVRFLHVKDGPATLEVLDQVAVGAGSLDVVAIIEAAPQAQRVVELDDFAGDVFEALRDSVTYLTEYGGTA